MWANTTWYWWPWWHHNSATIFKLVMGLMTSQLCNFRARSILWAFVVPKFIYSYLLKQAGVPNLIILTLTWPYKCSQAESSEKVIHLDFCGPKRLFVFVDSFRWTGINRLIEPDQNLMIRELDPNFGILLLKLSQLKFVTVEIISVWTNLLDILSSDVWLSRPLWIS